MENFQTSEDGQSPAGSKKDKQIVKELSTPAPFNCVTLRCSSTPSLSPYPASVGPTLPPAGENNAKLPAVSLWHMSREVPPRFRNHQEHKILLKRGQSLDGISPFLHTGDQSHVTTTLHSDPNVDLTSSPPLLSLSSLTYANSTCGPGPGAPLLSQGMAKIVMDKSRSRRQSESLNKTSWEYNHSKQEDNSEQVEPGVTADEENSESVPSSHCETALNRADAESMQQIQSQDDSQSVENRVEEEVGPKQVEAATDCKKLNQAVQLPTFTSNLEVLIPDTCHRKASGEVLKPGEMWGTSVESQVGWKVSHEVSQTVQAEKGSGLKKQIASESRGDVPKEGSSGHVKENPPDCLQDTQMIATKTIRRDREKGANESERDRSEHQSSGHGSSEDGTCSNSTSRTQSSCTEVTLQRMLNRSDLDPRVLSNTGWGQIQIKQSIAWNLEVGSRSETGQDWTGRAQVDVNSLSCPSWSRDLQGHVKGSRSHGTGNTWGQSEERIESKQGALLTGRDNSWVEAIKDEQEDSWHGNRKEALQQREQDRGSWGLGNTQWGENKGRAEQGERSWADSEDEGQNKQQQVWGDNRHPQHTPNNHMALQSSNQQHLQHSHSQLTPPNSSQESKDPPTGPLALNQNSGWKPGPIPHISSAIEPSGWEEPSPQSISRKMEIDDGTSAWGDPTHYDHRSVNMWDKSNLQQRSEPSQQHHESMSATTVTSRDKNAAWERSAGASEQFMNTSAAGWGKAFDAPSSWRDPEESGKGTVWSSSPSNSSKTGPKTMQDGWSDGGLKTSHHSSWEEEDSGSGMWGNRSQDNTSSFSSGGWNHGGRRTGGKAPLKGNGASSWTGLVTRQMSNMAITDEEALSAPERNRRGMNDYNGEMRRGGRGGGSFRSHSLKEPGTTGVFNTSAHLRGVQQPGVHHINPSPGVRAQVPQQFLPPQVSGSVVNPMFPTHSSPQHLALLGGLHPHMQQVQLAYQLLLQQQQQQQQQQHHFLSHRKFPHHLPPPPPPPLPPLPLLQHQDPQQIARIMAVLQQLPKSPTSFPGFVSGAEPESVISGVKEVGGAQPQFKWMMEAGHPLCPSPPDSIMLKNGLLPGQVKLRGDSSYPHYDMVGVENVGVASPGLIDSWYRIPGGKIGSTLNTPTWPPEFQPGVPWKGVQSPEPELNPYSGMLGENTHTDTEHHLLQDNTEINTVLPSPGAWPYCSSDTHTLASSWPPEPIGHRTNRNASQMPRPPPGLTHQKPAPWLGAGPNLPRGWSSERQNQEGPFVSESSWSGGSSTGSSWLLLSNLTPQIDSSTLKTICLQHGPLMTFNLGVAQGSALIRYCSVDEAAKAQSALHMCVLGNTTILAEFVSEEDVARYFTHSQSGETVGEADRQTDSEMGGGGEMKLVWENLDRDQDGLSLFNRWSHSREGGVWGGGAPGYQSNNLWGSPQVEDRGPGLLPGNLLGGGANT
ncbi:trinucleotide repeat-containing gene 6B protein-like isoform X1 [Silurus meridionalis]|uniref:trinucleotide repeat-containing gene 6B protein-like isoform X1 n=1 Tax=Silurus meridionalis TaxID=175797 RepID=UPI001EEB8A4F|nr:trinucleotide repeat-containing gene 6B protein-like isoform X1 [Silurus meridionalis]XP_046700424.1 trinucleotide repeat-containing gene 6B protein-like isoform X1 [Silurus meridionalis]